MARIKVATLLAKLAKEAGVKDTDPALLDALSITADIDDSLVTAIENNPNLITLDNAKNSGALKSHFYGKAMSGIDSLLFQIAEDNELPAGDLALIKTGTNTHIRLQKLFEKVKAQTGAKGKTPAAQEAMLKEVERFNREMLSRESRNKEDVKRVKDEADAAIIEYAVNSLLAQQKYANKELDPDINILTARTLLNQHLGDKKAVIVRDAAGALKLMNAENPDLEYLENNKPVKLSDLAASLLANKKLLEVNGGNGRQTPARKTPVTPTANKGPAMHKVLNAYDAQTESLAGLAKEAGIMTNDQ